MRKLSIILTLAFLYYSVASSTEIFSIRAFCTDSIHVQEDIHLQPGEALFVHNMDEKEHSAKRLTSLVKAKVDTSDKKMPVQDAYMQAFSELQNGPSWPAVYRDLVASTEPEEKAIRYGIKKLPAIVINDKYIIYGVTSLKEAVRIYEKKAGNQ
jgi:hypothetical protein